MKKDLIVALFALIVLALMPATLMAQSPGRIDLAGTTWDVKINLTPAMSVTEIYSFRSDGTFEIVDGLHDQQLPNTWRWEGKNLVMVIKAVDTLGNPAGGTLTGKMADSKTTIKGTAVMDSGGATLRDQGGKNSIGKITFRKITFSMTRR